MVMDYWSLALWHLLPYSLENSLAIPVVRVCRTVLEYHGTKMVPRGIAYHGTMVRTRVRTRVHVYVRTYTCYVHVYHWYHGTHVY